MENTIKRKMLFVECDSCGFGVEFNYGNETFFFCKEHKFGVNVENLSIRQICGPCSRDPERQGMADMERYDLYEEDNLCPICGNDVLALGYNYPKN